MQKEEAMDILRWGGNDFTGTMNQFLNHMSWQVMMSHMNLI